jgi:hypothetical protein
MIELEVANVNCCVISGKMGVSENSMFATATANRLDRAGLKIHVPAFDNQFERGDGASTAE